MIQPRSAERCRCESGWSADFGALPEITRQSSGSRPRPLDASGRSLATAGQRTDRDGGFHW